MMRTQHKTAQNQDGGQGMVESSQVEINERTEMQKKKEQKESNIVQKTNKRLFDTYRMDT